MKEFYLDILKHLRLMEFTNVNFFVVGEVIHVRFKDHKSDKELLEKNNSGWFLFVGSTKNSTTPNNP